MDSNPKNIKSHEINYQISFNAMRAYHSSELEHKRDMIIILNSFLAAMGALYFAIFTIFDKVNPSTGIETFIILVIPSIIISIFITIGILQIRLKYTEKIKAENNRYEKYRNECIISREYLGLNKDIVDYFKMLETKQPNSYSSLTDKDNILKKEKLLYWEQGLWNGIDRDGTGYSRALAILNVYSTTLVSLSWLMSLILSITCITLLIAK